MIALQSITLQSSFSAHYHSLEVIKMMVPILLTVLSLASLIGSGAASSAKSSPRVGKSFKDLQPLLSSAAEIYRPGSEGYINVTTRWSADTKPGLDVIVKVASEEDVQATVSSLHRAVSGFNLQYKLLTRLPFRSDMPTPTLSPFSPLAAVTELLASSRPSNPASEFISVASLAFPSRPPTAPTPASSAAL